MPQEFSLTPPDGKGKQGRTDYPSPLNGKTVFLFPLNDGSFYDITDTDIGRWADLYRAVNIDVEMRKMLGWLDAKPTHRKTRKGIKNFINSWLSRAQDKAGSNGNERTPQYESQREQIRRVIGKG